MKLLRWDSRALEQPACATWRFTASRIRYAILGPVKGRWTTMEYFGLVAVAGFIIWSLLSERKRTNKIRQYAESTGLTYIDAALPKSFPLSQTSVSWASSIKNVVAGDKNGKELLIFDCQLGTGKGRRMLTVAAVRGPVESFGPARFGPDLIMESVD